MIDQVEPIGWTSLDIALLVTLVPLLILSAFFSCSETAFFRLGQSQLIELRQRKTQPANAVLYLVRNRRNVLITILIGNMTANVLYFVVGSVLMLHTPGNIAVEIGIASGTLFSIVIFGEVLPKMAATARPIGISSLLAPPLLLLHRLITPIRRSVDFLIITPLSRLASTSKPEPLDARELATLVELSSNEGIIDQDEQRVLYEVVELSRIRVREVMTPRVRMIAAPSSASEDEIRAIISKTQLTQIPIFGEDLDDIRGMLHSKRYLQRSIEGQTQLLASTTRPQYIPKVATLDQLLTRFRESKTRLAIVVDEFGGTAGLVTLEDVLEELIGEIGDKDHHEIIPPKQLEDNKWLLDGNTGVRGWAVATGLILDNCPAATMGGLIAATLGRIPEIGDSIELGNLNIEVNSMDEFRVATVIVSLQPRDKE
ncbi:MAG: hemolysin family protein [Phycisphaerales bacterium]|jgi:CBS domain containing-hemolysin-like protein|nr:hemolysin family protein [Phycisphaerales bacterium]